MIPGSAPEIMRVIGAWLTLWASDCRVLVTVLTLAVGVALVSQLGDRPIWLDEVDTWRWSNLPFDSLFEATTDARHPPFYFAAMRWLVFWEGEFWLRLPSALFLVSTIPVVFLLGRAIHSSRAGLYAALLFATHPYVFHWALLARSNTAILFTCSAVFLLMVVLLRRQSHGTPAGVALWCGFIAFSVVAMMLHFLIAMLPLVSACAVMAGIFTQPECRRRLLVYFGAAHIIIVALYAVLPWGLGALLTSMENSITLTGTPSLTELGKTLLFARYGRDYRLIVVLGTLLFIVLGLARWHERRELPWAGVCLSWWLVPIMLPFVVPFILDINVFRPYNLLWAGVPLFIIVAVGLHRLPTRWANAVLVLVLCLNVWATAHYGGVPVRGWDTVYETVSAQYHKGDGIVFCPGYREKGFFYQHQTGGGQIDPTELNAYGWNLNPRIYGSSTHDRVRPIGETKVNYEDMDRLWIVGTFGIHCNIEALDAYLEDWPMVFHEREVIEGISVWGKAKADLGE